MKKRAVLLFLLIVVLSVFILSLSVVFCSHSWSGLVLPNSYKVKHTQTDEFNKDFNPQEIFSRNLHLLSGLSSQCPTLTHHPFTWDDDRVRRYRSHFDHILVDDLNHYLYCVVPKVSCTTWKSLFVRLRYNLTVSRGSSLIHRSPLTTHPLLSNYSPSEILRRLIHYKKFMFVRAPFERLLSAFNDKFRSHLGFGDVLMFREARRIFNFTEDEFRSSNITVFRQSLKFRDFLEYVASQWESGLPLNRHWSPVWNLCWPCHVQYDFVGRYDNMWADSNYVLHYLLNQSGVTYPRRADMSERDRQFWLGKTKTEVREEMSRIPEDLKRRVEKVYDRDLLLFGRDDEMEV